MGTKQKPDNPTSRPCASSRTKTWPDPWLYDTDALLRDLDFVRELLLKIPASQATYLPTNTAIEALWDLRERLRFLAVLRLQGQRRWKKNAGVESAGGRKKKTVSTAASIRGA